MVRLASSKQCERSEQDCVYINVNVFVNVFVNVDAFAVAIAVCFFGGGGSCADTGNSGAPVPVRVFDTYTPTYTTYIDHGSIFANHNFASYTRAGFGKPIAHCNGWWQSR